MPSNEYLVTNAELTATANSIREKLGSQAAIRWASGTGFKSSVDEIQTGGGSSSNDVRFLDYDGTVVQTYSAADFANLSELPANPTHAGLTSQGWNWSLADAKTYVASYGKLDIGQMYVTDDGKTRIRIRLEEGRLDPYLGLAVDGSADIDWGDGTTHSALTGSSTSTVVYAGHSYASAGEYTIAVDITGTAAITGTSNGSNLLRKTNSGSAGNDDKVYENAIDNIYIGNRLSISGAAFQNCNSLTNVTIPSGVTSIDGSAFSNCYSLTSVTIPSSVTSIGNGAFSNCRSLTSITIPSSVTSIDDAAFSNCYSLTSVTIPSSVTSIGNGAFSNCRSLTSITIPSEVTSIDNSAFGNCYSLASVTIPSSVTSIGNGAFSYCSGLSFVKFLKNTPPTCSNTNIWTNIPTDCQIIYPYASTVAYKSATNYPNTSTYLYLGFYAGTAGEELPATVTDGTTTYDLTWYANTKDAVAQTNPITTMQGEEVYCRSVLAA